MLEESHEGREVLLLLEQHAVPADGCVVREGRGWGGGGMPFG